MSPLSDEAVMEGHEFLEHAEEDMEAEQSHKMDDAQKMKKKGGLEGSNMGGGDQGNSQSGGGEQKPSKMENLKEKLHMKK